jgi:diguanylate cyclase (GGDEF)-like protein
VSDDGEPLHALVVAHDGGYRDYLTRLAQRLGFAAEGADDGDHALDSMARSHVDLIVVDDAGHTGPGDLISRLRSSDDSRNVYAMMVTSDRDAPATAVSALAAGFDDLLRRGSPEEELVAKMSAARRIIGRQRALAEKIHEMYGLAMHDELTGVFNHRFFVDEVSRLLREGVGLGIVLFDLDDFKVINDRFGHLTGDRVLRDLGALFHAATRPHDLVARYGGDEFVLIATGASTAELECIAERITNDICQLQWTANDATFRIGVSAGIATSTHLPTHATAAHLLEAADRDLYRAKREKKQRDVRHPERSEGSQPRHSRPDEIPRCARDDGAG